MSLKKIEASPTEKSIADVLSTGEFPMLPGFSMCTSRYDSGVIEVVVYMMEDDLRLHSSFSEQLLEYQWHVRLLFSQCPLGKSIFRIWRKIYVVYFVGYDGQVWRRHIDTLILWLILTRLNHWCTRTPFSLSNWSNQIKLKDILWFKI